MTAPPESIHQATQRLAPLAPPCFANRLAWLTYVIQASSVREHHKDVSPLIFKAGKPVEFNFEWSMCGDCDAEWRRRERVVERGKCRPDWLRQFVKEAAC